MQGLSVQEQVLGVEVNVVCAGGAAGVRRRRLVGEGDECDDGGDSEVDESEGERYVKAVLALEPVRRKREERYERYVRSLDRKRDTRAAEVDRRMRALIGTQQAEARRILG